MYNSKYAKFEKSKQRNGNIFALKILEVLTFWCIFRLNGPRKLFKALKVFNPIKVTLFVLARGLDEQQQGLVN